MGFFLMRAYYYCAAAAVTRMTVNECGANVRRNDADTPLTVSSLGANFVGSSTVFCPFGSPISTTAVALGSTFAAPRRLTATSTGFFPTFTTLRMTVRPSV